MRQSRNSSQQVVGAGNGHAHVVHDRNQNHPENGARQNSLNERDTHLRQE